MIVKELTFLAKSLQNQLFHQPYAEARGKSVEDAVAFSVKSSYSEIKHIMEERAKVFREKAGAGNTRLKINTGRFKNCTF